MSTNTENYQPGSELTLRDSEALLVSTDRTSSPLTVRAITLSLTKQDDQLIECRLTLIVKSELYNRIDSDALFNLKPEVRGSFSAGEFLPEPDIKIETTLKPDLLPRLTGHTANLDGR